MKSIKTKFKGLPYREQFKVLTYTLVLAYIPILFYYVYITNFKVYVPIPGSLFPSLAGLGDVILVLILTILNTLLLLTTRLIKVIRDFKREEDLKQKAKIKRKIQIISLVIFLIISFTLYNYLGVI